MNKLIVLTLIAFGCDSGGGGGNPGPDLLPGFTPPPPPVNGFQILLPPYRGLQPSTDIEMCTWTDKTTSDKNLDIKTLEAYQSGIGHHAVVYMTSFARTPGTTRECSGADTVFLRFVAGSGGEGQGIKNTAPGNLVYRVPPNMQIVINHHYLNATSSVQDGQTAVNVTLADPNAQNIPSDSLAFVDTNLNIPPGASSKDIRCIMQGDIDAWYFIPHMHRWGSHIAIDRTHAGATDRVFDVQWQPEYTFHPPEIRREVTDPFALRTGDEIHVHCDWNNTGTDTLTFGMEMCGAFGATIDSQGIGNLACEAVAWGHF